MPRYNGTGPMGAGPGTGRGMGPCGGGQAYGRGGAGRGQGRGLGWRRFWGYYPAANPTKKEETEMLSEEAAILEEELKAAKARLAQLKGQK
jgi:hypothetical protein